MEGDVGWGGEGRSQALFIRKSYPTGGGGSGWVPQRGRLFKWDFPSANFRVKPFVDPPPPRPSDTQSLRGALGWESGGLVFHATDRPMRTTCRMGSAWVAFEV